MTILATVGSTAPFVGLFGTTFGVINAFDGMATEGSGPPRFPQVFLKP